MQNEITELYFQTNINVSDSNLLNSGELRKLYSAVMDPDFSLINLKCLISNPICL